MMRVIGGNVRGRRLRVPKGMALRPTGARVKGALFNILPRDLSGMRLLDLFAGTGNVTIEALSRGIAQAVLVDASAQSARAIRDNLRMLGLTDRARLLTMPVDRAVRQLARQREAFDLIFLDPPYGRSLAERTLKIIADGSILRPNGTLVAEHSVRDPIGARYGALKMQSQRRYGDTILSFFGWQREANTEAKT
jgi:16S rRNA (guanine966-N2)-methyltransferase